MKKFLKLITFIPILIGAVIGTVLFILGEEADAPGLCLIGFAAAFLLTMWGIYNAGVIKKGFLAPILLFCFGAGGIMLSVVLLLDGEFGETPGRALIGIIFGAALVIISKIKLKKAKVRE